MQNWENVLWLFKQPEFIALLIFAMALQPILKFLRRFYPKSLQKIANDSDAFTEELAKNEKDSKLMRRSYLFEMALFFLLPALVFATYLFYSYFTGTVLSPKYVRGAFASLFAPILFINIGIVSINHAALLKSILKSDYQRYLEISDKGNRIDPLAIFFEKNKKVFGYGMITFGLVGFITMSIIGLE
jgi:hypothetical protein